MTRTAPLSNVLDVKADMIIVAVVGRTKNLQIFTKGLRRRSRLEIVCLRSHQGRLTLGAGYLSPYMIMRTPLQPCERDMLPPKTALTAAWMTRITVEIAIGTSVVTLSLCPKFVPPFWQSTRKIWLYVSNKIWRKFEADRGAGNNRAERSRKQ